MKQSILLISTFALLTACGGNETTQQTSSSQQEAKKPYDTTIGAGKFTSVNISDTINQDLVEAGKLVFQNKCVSCHKTNTDKVVGPGLKGITARKKAEWIMNYVSNPELMIEKDPEIQAQVKIYAVRMPNQGISETEARNLYEYLRQNDL